ncbi:hypothetical protein H3Z85_02710 [Chryseobacterium indologenes]|nr:hypothetical protein [Chryseobacterium indologenes]GAE64712.1 hypothetical protein CIN01S_09_01970 [Chryseobacterium indologenes NBRC 14944]AYZ34653.1 hypothetical protein EGY07_03265 [Chryseobacterium indologenes]MBF6643229.1 hypothetical protein [Chryseobacterium indologenes]QPQ52418.1 hypothetical protein H3Z85_02710 [Chryseobacterium indologenes]QQQ72884.1 hypothetical protein JHW31_09215 [Chryseobacterium indologenes]
MKNIFNFLAIVAFGSLVNAQVSLNNGAQNAAINNSNVAIDLSSAFSTEAGAGANVGKGIVVPSVDLVNFQFDTSLADGSTFPTWFDGMVVYNNATGTTLTTGQRSSTATAVTPGFYYYYNPTGSTTSSVQPGVWRPLGGNANAGKVNILPTETITNTQVNNAQVYAIKGTFTASGTSTAVNIPAPAGMSAMYGITIYKAGTNTVYDRSLYSYTIATTAGNAVTGSPSMSVVYPSGTYDYVLEYLK